jgi:tellurite resistance-related uncharacterized protein
MVGFRTDEHGDWVALLDCGHPQHVRHTPPFMNRPWVTTEEGRRGKLGQHLDCVRCDRFELPPHFVPYKKTAVFTESTVPAALLRDHTTKTGVWARIVVLEGTLRYVVPALDTDVDLAAGRDGIVVPEVPHHVEPRGPVRFYVEFHAAPADDR